MSGSLKIYDAEILPASFFQPFYIYVMEEKDALIEAQSDDYEMQLYQDYIEREGVVAISDNSKSVEKVKKKQANNDSVYEKTKVKHGDQRFYQFSKKIRACPKQCLRCVYCSFLFFVPNISGAEADLKHVEHLCRRTKIALTLVFLRR